MKNPQRTRTWRDLLAVVESGAKVKRPEQQRILVQADEYMRAQFALYLAAAAWYDAVTSDLDDTTERAALMRAIRRLL